MSNDSLHRVPDSDIRVGRVFGWGVLILMLWMVALGGLGSCFYARPKWYRGVEHSRTNADEGRLAIVMLSSLTMQPRGIAEHVGIPITLRQVCDVWICDPQRRTARKVATIKRPRWIRGAFSVWMINWQSHGEQSSLYLRVSGARGILSDTPVTQYVRIDFDRNTLERPTVVYLGSPRTKPTRRDFVNPPPEYGILSVREWGDTLSIWTVRSPDWRARFWIDKARGNILALAPTPKRPIARPLEPSVSGKVCPDRIRGMPSPTESGITFGTPPVFMAAITRVDASCDQRRHPIVGDDNDGEMEFFIDLAGWIQCEAKDPERDTYGASYGEEVIFEALSASSEVLGSTSMGYLPSPGGTVMHLTMRMDPEQLPHVTRVVARWDRNRNTR